MNYALAIHTASPDLGLAIATLSPESLTSESSDPESSDHVLLAHRAQTWDLGRDLSTQFHHYLADFIQPQTWQDLAFIAVAKGPGGFTGTRIGVVAARTLAQQLRLPLFAISTLAAIAWSAAKKNSPANPLVNQSGSIPAIDQTIEQKQTIAVEMKAQRGEVYGGIYAIENQIIQGRSIATLTTLKTDAVMSSEHWQTQLAQFPHHLLVTAEAGLGWTAPSLLELACLDWLRGDRANWSAALPFYGQSPV